MPTPTILQARRPIEIQTPLGDNVLGLRSFRLEEKLGRPFVIEAELSSDDPDIAFDDITGQPVSIRLNLQDGTERYFHAIVARFVMLGQQGDYFHYSATLAPWLWGLTRSADCRMFQDKTAPDIVQQIFRDRGFKDFELGITGTYPTREYCIQYRESAFNFVSRLLEEEGIAYFFKHTKDQGLLVLADQKSAYSPPEGYAQLTFWPTGDADKRDDAVKSWLIEHEVQPTTFSLNDYNFLTPKTDLASKTQIAQMYGLNDGEVYDFPGEYLVTAEGARLSRIRLEEIQVGCQTVRAETTCLALSAGSLVTLASHPRADQNVEHLVTSMSLSYDAGEFSSSENSAPKFSCSFTAIPSSVPFRPARLTPRPVISGPQHAMVVGPSGEEIHTDEHGRVKLHFFWDRDSKADETSSCWVRVAQGWAGKKWGSMFLPRVGHEVLVEFIEGDPDRPIATGSVYNADNAPPYALPDEKTKSTLKSASSKGGGGFNEFRFEDKKGEEQIFLQAEKDTDTRVKNDAHEWIGNDRHLVVKNDQVEAVTHDRHEKIGNDLVQEIGRDHHLAVKGKVAIEITGSQSIKVSDDVIQEFAKNQSTQVTKDLYIKAENIVIEATTNITINVGDSFIAIESGGIKIGTTGDIELQATGNIKQTATADLKLEATGNAGVKGTGGLSLESAAQAELKSPSTTVSGDGMLTLKGGMVKIN